MNHVLALEASGPALSFHWFGAFSITGDVTGMKVPVQEAL